MGEGEEGGDISSTRCYQSIELGEAREGGREGGRAGEREGLTIAGWAGTPSVCKPSTAIASSQAKGKESMWRRTVEEREERREGGREGAVEEQEEG